MSAHIAFVAPFGLGQKTTVWARTLPLARALVAQGHRVLLIIPPWDTPADSGRCWSEAGVRIINVSLRGGILFVVWRMVQVIAEFQPDIVHIVKPRAHAGLVQWLLWQRRQFVGKGPRIFLDVDDWEQAWAAINPYHPLVARFLAWQEEWGIRHADGITAASRWLVERVQTYAPTMPVLYLPNGVTAPVLPPVLLAHPDTKQILFYSRYVEVDPAWLAAFWCALSSVEPTATLVVFGDALQPARPATFQAVMQHRCPTAALRVRWQHYDAGLVDQLFAESGCVIFPSDKTPLHEAKCSVRLATTLLRGVPVVASAVGEQQQYGAAGAAELVVADAPPQAFAAAVARVLAQPQARLLRQAHAREWLLRDYSWEKLGDALAAFYRGHQQG
jgi:glycosyltransferase involved in cell wall biosynthesis